MHLLCPVKGFEDLAIDRDSLVFIYSEFVVFLIIYRKVALIQKILSEN